MLTANIPRGPTIARPCYLQMVKLCHKGWIGVTRQRGGRRALLAEEAIHKMQWGTYSIHLELQIVWLCWRWVIRWGLTGNELIAYREVAEDGGLATAWHLSHYLLTSFFDEQWMGTSVWIVVLTYQNHFSGFPLLSGKTKFLMQPMGPCTICPRVCSLILTRPTFFLPTLLSVFQSYWFSLSFVNGLNCCLLKKGLCTFCVLSMESCFLTDTLAYLFLLTLQVSAQLFLIQEMHPWVPSLDLTSHLMFW